ncbi:nSTAND3 domain-containing NTPase [Methanoplanus limicola]|nr:restriction endonuclease [Methanoplanus limicola]
MADYDLGCLSSHEFELLVCDIFQKKWNVTLETFKEGRDNGIDIRGCFKSGTTIIQCKHYFKSSVSKLKSNLKKEVEKIEKIKPNEYIVVASTGLTPGNKTEIKDLFEPYCQSESDVFGREDILNYLRNNEDIVKKHPKLWFTSSAVFENILNKDIYNDTDIDIENFIEFLPKMVITEEFQKVEKILEEDSVCIISGEPGIGKSTLMKALVVKYSANGYQPIKISNNIKDAFKIIDRGKKQVFYYDDFLGTTYYNINAGKNEDKSIESFVKAIKRYKGNIKFILTTREYILNQAQQKSDVAERFGDLEYIISLKNASKTIKAQILYNHLWHSEIKDENIEQIIKDENYLKIINHRNFNPRVIETMTDSILVNSSNFVDSFLYNLEYPEKIWSRVFGSCISDYSKTILVLLGIFEGEASINAIFECFKYYYYSEDDLIKLKEAFNNSLKELDGTFTSSITYHWDYDKKIRYKNPSVEDFIYNKVYADDFLLERICDCISDVNQIIEIWDIFVSQTQAFNSEDYPRFSNSYFLAIKRIGKKYIESGINDNLATFTIHLLSINGQLKIGNISQYTNDILKMNLNKFKCKRGFYYRDLTSVLKELNGHEDEYKQIYYEMVNEAKIFLQSENYSFITDFTKIVEFYKITGLNLEGTFIEPLKLQLEQIIQEGIIIETDPDSCEIQFFCYDLDSKCHEQVGSEISELEKLNREIIHITDFFEIDNFKLSYPIEEYLEKYYSDYEPDEDRYEDYLLERDLIQEESEFQEMFEGLHEKNC